MNHSAETLKTKGKTAPALKPIKSALISVYYKEGLDEIIRLLQKYQVPLYSTGGTQTFIESLGADVTPVERLTSYPSILGGRVKTLHPKIFGGILGRRSNPEDQQQMQQYQIPEIDLVIVDLYPFEETVAKTNDEKSIIEKIDIGGTSLIRAAAKNFEDVLVVAGKSQYPQLISLLQEKKGYSALEDRRAFAAEAFNITSHYDTAIFKYFNRQQTVHAFKESILHGRPLRYGENPHQQGMFYGNLEEVFEILGGKELSYNNLVDIDAAMQLIGEFQENTFAIIKHTNACGVASRPDVLQAWKDALAADPLSAFGGILITNTIVTAHAARAIHELFFEVLLAPGYEPQALELLRSKKNRILLQMRQQAFASWQFRSLLNGVVAQETDSKTETPAELKPVTQRQPDAQQVEDLLFANRIVKHLKSNAIVLAKNKQMLGMGCGQTSRVDALKQAILKARTFGFDLSGAVMASDAFFPFPDCVEIAHQAGISAVIHPGGSVRDQESIDYCNAHQMTMVVTGFRHFRH
ncbi:MAG: bifunctional purine biosynthesis protein PurH [Chitinophagales bacterium]|nr:MAG: bifunctional purine biosynthesis protein PurH [Chitinophagales bacterium]